MATMISQADMVQLLVNHQPVTVLDVRRKADVESGPAGMPGAQWRDPAAVDSWISELAAGQEVVVYCVRGGSVSQSVQQRLADAGIAARYLEGGLAGYSPGQ